MQEFFSQSSKLKMVPAKSSSTPLTLAPPMKSSSFSRQPVTKSQNVVEQPRPQDKYRKDLLKRVEKLMNSPLLDAPTFGGSSQSLFTSTPGESSGNPVVDALLFVSSVYSGAKGGDEDDDGDALIAFVERQQLAALEVVVADYEQMHLVSSRG
jgi:hypothetical protein